MIFNDGGAVIHGTRRHGRTYFMAGVLLTWLFDYGRAVIHGTRRYGTQYMGQDGRGFVVKNRRESQMPARLCELMII